MAHTFRNRGIKVVADTTSAAERDFKKLGLNKWDELDIADSIVSYPLREKDRSVGATRIRSFQKRTEKGAVPFQAPDRPGQFFEIAFITCVDSAAAEVVQLVLAARWKGELEPMLKIIARAAADQYAPGISSLMKQLEERNK